MSGQITEDGKRRREYRPFTRDAAARVIKKFEIKGKEDAVFKVVTDATNTYERYQRRPDYQERKEAVGSLRKAIDHAARAAARRSLDGLLEDTVLRRLGEILTYEGIERLLGRYVARQPIPDTKKKWDDYDELTRLDRSARAAEVGPKLLVALLKEIQSALDELDKGMNSTGGRPIKHLYRHVVASELARYWHWFSDARPTSTKTGKFAKFCVEVLHELDCDTTGFKDSLPDILDDADTFIIPSRGPRSRRKASARKQSRRKASSLQ